MIRLPPPHLRRRAPPPRRAAPRVGGGAVAFGIPFFFARKTDVASCAFLVAVSLHWIARGLE